MEIGAYAAILLPIALIHIVGWAMPGPNHLTIITASVTAGRSGGMKAALGIAAGGLTWTLIAMSGIAVVFDLFPRFYIALRLVGAGYLVYLGVNAFRAARRGGVFNLNAAQGAPATVAPFRTAYLVMMTNPKAVLFFGSVLTAFIPPESSAFLMALIALQFGVLGALLNALVALFFSSPKVAAAFQSAALWVSLVFGILFCGLGLVVALDVVREMY